MENKPSNGGEMGKNGKLANRREKGEEKEKKSAGKIEKKDCRPGSFFVKS